MADMGDVLGKINDFALAVGLDIKAIYLALNLKAPLASPTFTGVPAAPTATVGTNTTQIATTAFVITELSSAEVASADKWTTARDLSFTGNVTGSLMGVDGTGNVSATLTIANSSVTLARMADVATSTVFYRKTAGTGAPEVQTLNTLKTDLGLTGTNSGDQTITLTGDVTGSGSGSFTVTLSNDVVSNVKLANMATMTIKGNNAGSTGEPIDLNTTQVRAMLSGTSGSTFPLLNGSNTWSGTQTLLNVSLVLETQSDTASLAPQLYARKSRAGGTASASGDTLYNNFIAGHDGSGYINTVAISALTTEAYDSTHAGSELRFATVITGNAVATRVPRWRIDGAASFQPYADNAYSFGDASHRPTVLWAVSGTISTSDANEKDNIRELNEVELECSIALSRLPKIFQWIQSIQEKGAEAARLHCSPTVQSIISTMESFNLNPFKYGFVCFDEWDAIYEPVVVEEIVEQKDGSFTVVETPTGEMKCVREAGSRYGLRDTDFLKFIMVGTVKRMDDIEKRLVLLEKPLN